VSIKRAAYAALVTTVACGGETTRPHVPREWDFDGIYKGEVLFEYDDTSYRCGDYVCGGGTIVRFDCPTDAEVWETGDSTLAGTLFLDLGSCAETRRMSGDTITHLRVAENIPFEVFFARIDDDPAYLFGAHGDLFWGTGSAADFEALLGCVPLEKSIGYVSGGDPRRSPPYISFGTNSRLIGAIGSGYEGVTVLCGGRKVRLWARFDVMRPQ